MVAPLPESWPGFVNPRLRAGLGISVGPQSPGGGQRVTSGSRPWEAPCYCLSPSRALPPPSQAGCLLGDEDLRGDGRPTPPELQASAHCRGSAGPAADRCGRQEPPRSPGPAASPTATGNRGSLSPSVLRWFEVQLQASDLTEMICAVNTSRPKTSFQMRAPAPQIGPVRGFGARVYHPTPCCAHFPCLGAAVSCARLRRQSDKGTWLCHHHVTTHAVY